MTHYEVFVYGPVFLGICHKDRVQQVPLHIVKEISLVLEHCRKVEKPIVQKAIQDNGCLAPHKSVLLAFLGSEVRNDRKFAMEIKLNIPELGDLPWPAKCHGIRPMRTPAIYFGASCLYGLADWTLADTELPLTMDLSEEELKGIIDESLFADLPCHTTAMERGVKGTTAAALKCANQTERDGLTF